MALIKFDHFFHLSKMMHQKKLKKSVCYNSLQSRTVQSDAQDPLDNTILGQGNGCKHN